MSQPKSMFMAVMSCLTFNPPIIAQFDIVLNAWKDNKKISERHDGVNICTIGSDVRTLEIRVSIAPTPDFPLQEYGPFQWQLSIEVGGNIEITDFVYCTNDIAGLLMKYCDCCECGSRGCGTEKSGFGLADIAYREDNNGRYGIVSSRVLSFREPMTLSPIREQEVLVFDVEIQTAEEEIISTIQFIDGLHSKNRKDGFINGFGVYTNTFKEFENEVGLIIAKSISSPSEISASLRTPQSAGITWVDNALNETSFVLERRLRGLGQGGEGSGGTEDWTQISEVPVNTTMYIDPVLPPNNEATYRIAAKNANGTSAKVTSQAITTPDSRWQLKLYDPVSDKWVDLKRPSQFHPDWGTAVIVHGWQSFGRTFDPINNWMKDIAKAIQKRKSNTNIIGWEWIKEATGRNLPEGSRPVYDQIELLSKSLKDIIPTGYNKPLHFMGHSFGSYIVARVCKKFLGLDPQNPKEFPQVQVTLFDPADIGLIFNLTTEVNLLRANKIYTDMYHGFSSVGTHNVNVWVNVPGVVGCAPLDPFCHGSYRWYIRCTPCQDSNIG